MDATANWTLRPAWWSTLDWAVTNAQAASLNVILDLHEFNAIGRNPEAKKAQFIAFWRQVSDRYAEAGSEVIFEILNEPSQQLTPNMWNQWLLEALTIIRQKNPTRTVIVGPAEWNSIERLRDLKLPTDDRNLIVTVHYYQPFEFTHQGAPWVNRQDKTGIDWQGTESERAAIAGDFDRANAWARTHNRPLFLGEFGAYDKASMESRTRYLNVVARAAEQRGWAWAYWQFDSDFILYDVQSERWVEPILQALIPKSE
jgi:endoglucanase